MTRVLAGGRSHSAGGLGCVCRNRASARSCSSRQSRCADRSLPTPWWPASRPVAQMANCADLQSCLPGHVARAGFVTASAPAPRASVSEPGSCRGFARLLARSASSAASGERAPARGSRRMQTLDMGAPSVVRDCVGLVAAGSLGPARLVGRGVRLPGESRPRPSGAQADARAVRRVGRRVLDRFC
jgi:hypothetical protein